MKENRRHTEGNARLFSDPKAIVSSMAFLLSIISLFWTIGNQSDQNRRWDTLNAATVEFTEGKFYTWREMTREETFGTKWGYDPLILGTQEGWNKFRLIYCIQLRDPTSGVVLPHSNPVFTVAEAHAEARRIGITSGIALFRVFRSLFVFENGGKSDARDCSIQVNIKTGADSWRPAFASNAPIRIPAGHKFNVSFDFALPLDTAVPDTIRFKIHVDFTDIHGKRSDRDLVVGWDSKQDYWFYGPSEKS